jgi:hypothetical protein
MILPGHKGNFWEITAVITAVMNISAVITVIVAVSNAVIELYCSKLKKLQ